MVKALTGYCVNRDDANSVGHHDLFALSNDVKAGFLKSLDGIEMERRLLSRASFISCTGKDILSDDSARCMIIFDRHIPLYG
jgi:hypothetical protein